MNSYPRHIEIEITNHCQLHCKFCPHHKMKRKQGYMSWEVLEKIIAESVGRTKTSYCHQIGEPLLHKQLIPMINYVSSAGIRTSISTNAILLDEKMTAKLFDSQLDELTLALDSLDKKTYESLRKGSKFERVIENIDRCIDMRRSWGRGPFIELQVILMKENEHEAQAFVHKYGDALGDFGHLLLKGFSTFAGHVEDKAPIETPPRRFDCNKLDNSLAIHWNGDIALCCRDYDGFTVMGNVMKDSIGEIWNSDKMNEYRGAFKEKDFSKLEFCARC